MKKITYFLLEIFSNWQNSAGNFDEKVQLTPVFVSQIINKSNSKQDV
jgi:hypothetical protein